MLDHFNSTHDETGAIGIDLTASEIATMIVSSLIGTAAVGLITLTMLL